MANFSVGIHACRSKGTDISFSSLTSTIKVGRVKLLLLLISQDIIIINLTSMQSTNYWIEMCSTDKVAIHRFVLVLKVMVFGFSLLDTTVSSHEQLPKKHLIVSATRVSRTRGSLDGCGSFVFCFF